MRGVALDADLVDDLRAQLPDVAARTVTAITAEVAEYADAFSGEMGATIQGAVQLALAGFLRLAAQAPDDETTPIGPARDGAYALGRGEARSGRTADALLAAYRVGARTAWREMSQAAVARGVGAPLVAEFAELVFAYIDELSAASVAGHTDEQATTGRVRQQYRDRLALALVSGADADALTAAAQRADWTPPHSLVAVLVPSRMPDNVAALDPRTLVVPGEVVGLVDHDVLLVPSTVLRQVRSRAVVVGPRRPWTEAAVSFARTLRTFELGLTGDTDDHLPTLVLTADPLALQDLRAHALRPLADLRPGTRERLEETLRSWLLHHGRRDDVAADLHVHAQTVRYRMGQLRELFDLTDPDLVLRLTIALAPATP